MRNCSSNVEQNLPVKRLEPAKNGKVGGLILEFVL
jgi:hypothetical protein